MAFTKYQNTNNASSLLIADISASATTMLITDGDQNLFPSKFPFLLTLEHLDSEGNVILREIVKATASNQNSYTVVRGAGTCVQDDTASNRSQDNTAHAFYSGDRVSLYRTAEQVKDIQDRLETSANDTAIADEYSSSQTYAIGDIVMYKGDRYVCSTDVSAAEEFDSTKWTKVSVQYDLAQAQEDIEILKNSGGSSDHLEEECLVGEKYVATDKLFKQETPSLDNSTVDYNIGDVATNTQVHIQRIGSGVASNIVKLKVKMTGSPTTALHCDVYEGTSYDVSSTEKAWTGTTLLASSQVAYTSISSSYAEITFTLDNEIGGTEGQLLDVVVYQENNTVNASNYYQIACDSTQYSEAFRCVSVNGSTKTPSYYMPYCVSDGFAQYLLCKVGLHGNTTPPTKTSPTTYTDVNYSSSSAVSHSVSANSERALGNSFTNENDVPISITYTFTGYRSSSASLFRGILVDGVFTLKAGLSTSSTSYTYTEVLLPGQTIQHAIENRSTTNGVVYYTAYSITMNTFTQTINVPYGYAVSGQVRGLGEEGKLMIFGMNNNKFFKDNGLPDYDATIKRFLAGKPLKTTTQNVDSSGNKAVSLQPQTKLIVILAHFYAGNMWAGGGTVIMGVDTYHNNTYYISSNYTSSNTRPGLCAYMISKTNLQLSPEGFGSLSTTYYYSCTVLEF